MISHTHMHIAKNAMLCYALFCVAHTCKRTTSFAACTQNTETTDDKKRKHINHPDAERRRCAFRRDSLRIVGKHCVPGALDKYWQVIVSLSRTFQGYFEGFFRVRSFQAIESPLLFGVQF